MNVSVGECEQAFAAAAAADGIALTRYKLPWINQRGHLGLPPKAGDAAAVLEEIFDALGGIRPEQAAKRTTPLPGDFIHVATNTVIEVDEAQHFTSFRHLSLSLYPTTQPLNFDAIEYSTLCHSLAPQADAYRRTKTAVAFGVGGRQRQRAYHDALRDLALPAMGHPPIIRAAAPDGNGRAAYARARERVRNAIFDV